MSNFIILTNKNNIAVKFNFTTPIHAHLDRHTIYDIDRLTGEDITIHKCTLHIDTHITDTNFDNVIFTITDNELGVIKQKVDENYSEIILQNNTNPWQKFDISIDSKYITSAFEKNKTNYKPNKTIVCSTGLKIHESLYPFNYTNTFGNEEE